MNKFLFASVLLSVLSFGVITAQDSLVGSRYFGVGYAMSDVKGITTKLNELGLGVNVPVNTNVDIYALGRLGWISYTVSGFTINYKSSSISLGGLYHFAPKANLDPYVKASLDVYNATAEVTQLAISSSTSKTGFNIGAGFEYTQNKFEVVPEISYLTVDSTSKTIAGLTVGYNFTETFSPTLSYVNNLTDSLSGYALAANFRF